MGLSGFLFNIQIVEPQKRVHSQQLAAVSFKYTVRKTAFLLIFGQQS
jgi:hypothetical protein